MKHLIHKIICWYLHRCGGAFHCFNYGPPGRYAVLMSDDQYHRYMALASDSDTGKRLMSQEKLMRWYDEQRVRESLKRFGV